MDNKYLDIIGLGIFKALNDKRYPILVNGKISESAIPTSITNSITSILSLIPDAASSENKLADKNFVNSSIATNTATFRGTFDDLATLQATSADINDYAFYVHTDEIGNTAYDRYKHNGSAWVFEYTLNNSSFTAEQWSAINSGITTTKVGNYDAHLINYSNPHKVTKSQVGLGNVENVALSSWAGSNKITTLGTITTGVWNGSKIGNDYLANSSITIGTTAISLGSTAKSLAGIEKLQLNDANSNLVYDSTTGSWKLTGNLLVTGFISAGAKGNSSSGGGSTYTQREWAEIKIMSASEIGLLASAYSVKEAYNELNTAIETLAGKATNVKFTQTLTSGKQIGSISIDGKSTSLFAPANYAWSEVTGKPSFAAVATSGSYSDLTNKPTIASLMGSTAIGGTSSYIYWNGSAWATKALGTAAFASSSDFAAASHTHSNYVDLTSKQTITGNKIFSGAIQVGAIGINTDNVGLYGYGEDAVEIHAENTLTLCGERNTYIGNADNSAMVDIQEDMAGYNAETGVETWYIYRDGYAVFQSILGALANSLAIKLNGGTTEGTNLFTFNNSASKTINITPSAIGAAAASHTHSYLPLSGGTMSNTNVVTNLNADLLDGLHASSFSLAEHTHSQYLTSALIPAKLARKETYPPGYFIIKINNNNSEWMLSFDVKIVVTDGSYTIRFSEDNRSMSKSWSSPSASMIDGEDSVEVKFGYSQTNKWVAILIPESYVGISITNVANGYAPIDTYALNKLFSIDFYMDDVLQYLGTVQKTITIYPPSKEGHTHTFASLTSKPTTISGYGITDAYTKTQTDTKLSGYLPLSGGTITGNYDALSIKRNNAYASLIKFENTSGVMGYLGFNSTNIPIMYTADIAASYYLLHAGNYNSYAPKLDGTGASGTWAISISGNAATATNADTLDGYHASQVLTATHSSDDLNEISVPKILRLSDVNPNLPSSIFRYGNLLTVKYPTTDTAWQLIGAYNSDALWFRRGTWYADGTGTLRTNAWKVIAFTDSNVASATKLQNSRTIWGQSFDGTGNVSGELSDVETINFVGNWMRIGLVRNSSNVVQDLIIQANGGLPLSINPDGGNVGIGTKSPSYKLHIAGVAYASEGLVSDGYISAAATSTSSDIRLKDNISEISSEMALKWLSMLKPKSWSWNSLAGVKGQSMGFVAQDVEGILPQMIRKRRDNGYLTLDYTQLHALEVSALQSHEKRIEELERENKILKEELNKLKLNAN